MHKTTRAEAQHGGLRIGAIAAVLVLLIGVVLLKEAGAGPTKPEASPAASSSQEKPKTGPSAGGESGVRGPERLSTAPVPVLAADALETTVP